MRSRIRNEDTEPGVDEDNLYEMMRRIKDMWMMGTTCMRMISHQRLPKPRLEIRAEQNGDGGVGVSKSDDHLCQ